MAICSPREPVYYYECSAGEFRLVYFVPPDDLRGLCAKDGISRQAVLDFPDGVDLDCMEADFDDFSKLYGWRPAMDPDALRRTFLAMFSSTRRWKMFRGSGLIPARDLECHLETVAAELEKKCGAPTLKGPRQRASARARRKNRSRELRMQRVLKRMPLQGIDGRQDLRRQKFSHIAMVPEGDSAVRIFSTLHDKRRH